MAPKSVTFRRHDHLVSVLFGDLLSHSYNITFSMFLYLVHIQPTPFLVSAYGQIQCLWADTIPKHNCPKAITIRLQEQLALMERTQTSEFGMPLAMGYKCSEESCTFASSKNVKKCPAHPTSQLVPSGPCPVYIILCAPCKQQKPGSVDRRFDEEPSEQLYGNQSPQSPTVQASPMVVREAIKEAVSSNLSLTPSQITLCR